jgi:hypothetical protein
MSLDSLDGRKPDTRTTAGLKHIKIDIAQLHLNQNELEWRKTVTAATAALKMPHLLEDNYRPYTHAKLGELYESLNLELPTHLQTPTKPPSSRASSTPAKPVWWLAATKAKGDTFAQQATSYTDRIIEQDLRFVVVWVTVGVDNQPELESDYDSECRTILFTHMKKSLKTYAHMTKDVVHGDCRALFNAVVLQHNPEPRQLLVSCFDQLVKHVKTASQPYQPWVTGLNDIFNTLDTVEFTLPPHVRLGFTMALLGSDKRYTPILERAQEKEWSNEECNIHFNRHAAKINDQISHIRIPLPTPHSANAIVPDSDYSNPAPEGEEGGDTEEAYYSPNQTPDSDSEEEQGGDTEEDNQQQQPSSSAQEIAAAQKWIEEERARRVNRKPYEQREHTQHPCLRYSEGRSCYYDPCPFSHFIGPDAAHNPLPPATPATAPTPAAAELHKTYSHEVNMVTTGWAKGTSVTIDTRITNGIANIHTTVLSSKLVKQADGKSPRFYSVVLPTAYLSQLHEQFAYMI